MNKERLYGSEGNPFFQRETAPASGDMGGWEVRGLEGHAEIRGNEIKAQGLRIKQDGHSEIVRGLMSKSSSLVLATLLPNSFPRENSLPRYALVCLS